AMTTHHGRLREARRRHDDPARTPDRLLCPAPAGCPVEDRLRGAEATGGRVLPRIGRRQPRRGSCPPARSRSCPRPLYPQGVFSEWAGCTRVLTNPLVNEPASERSHRRYVLVTSSVGVMPTIARAQSGNRTRPKS